MSLPEVIQVAVQASVSTIVLTHLWPLPADKELVDHTIAAFMAEGFEGRVVFAQDGLEVMA